jgi:hypothetical protein
MVQPKVSITRNIQRKYTWNKNEYYEENVRQYTYIIIHKLLQSSSNTLCNHLDLDVDWIYRGFEL